MEGLALAFMVFIADESERALEQPGYIRACRIWRGLGGGWISNEEYEKLLHGISWAVR